MINCMPPAANMQVWTMTNFSMGDLGGLAFIDRQGSGALGGVGTNYVANLIVGSNYQALLAAAQALVVLAHERGGLHQAQALQATASRWQAWESWQVAAGKAE